MGLILLLLHLPLFPPFVHLVRLPHSENLFDSLAEEKETKKHTKDQINLISLTGFIYH